MRALLDRRDEVYVVTISHHEHDLPGIPPLIRVDQKVLESTFLDSKNDLLEGDIALGGDFLVLPRTCQGRAHSFTKSETERALGGNALDKADVLAQQQFPEGPDLWA